MKCTALLLLPACRDINMPAQGLYEYLLLHQPWQPPQPPQAPTGGMTGRQHSAHNLNLRMHDELVRDIPVLRGAVAAETRGQQEMLADLAAARQLYQLDQVGCHVLENVCVGL
jgi:hypothetical protein